MNGRAQTTGARSPPRSQALVPPAAGRGQCTLSFPNLQGALPKLPEKKTRRLCQQLLGTDGL